MLENRINIQGQIHAAQIERIDDFEDPCEVFPAEGLGAFELGHEACRARHRFYGGTVDALFRGEVDVDFLEFGIEDRAVVSYKVD